MSEFYNIVIGKNAVPALAITVVLMFVMPALFLIYWMRRNRKKLNIKFLIWGAVGFIISARVLELGVHFVCLIMDNPVSRFINGNTIAYVLYGITMAGVFEECGRYIILKYVIKKDLTPENVVLYGIGHGGIEVFTVLLPSIILYLAIAVLFSSGDINNALKTLNITEETASAALPAVQSASLFGYGMMVMNVIERLFAMLLHVGFTVVVYYGIVTSKKKYLFIAIILHMLIDAFPALFQRGIVPLWSVELWGALWTVIVVVIAVKLYKKMKDSFVPEKV